MCLVDGIWYGRWPWGRENPVKLKTFIKTVKDIHGNEVQFETTEFSSKAIDWMQMEADDQCKKIIIGTLIVIVAITIITLMGLTIHYRWKIQQMKIGKI